MVESMFNGVLQEIVEKYPNVDIVGLLQDKLRLSLDKAEILAGRIEREILRKSVKSEHKILKSIMGKTDKTEVSQKQAAYSVNSLSNKEFEHFTKWLLQELGYDIHPEKFSTNLGVDYVASKDEQKTAVLARKTPKDALASDAMVLLAQQAKSIYGCERAIVLVSSGFSVQAKSVAERLDVELWDAEVLESKIFEVRKRVELEVGECFALFSGSLLSSLLGLEEGKAFKIEPRVGEKFDVYFPGVKFPLLTFQVQNGVVVRCVFRVKYNEPVCESDAEALIRCDRGGVRFGPDEVEAYALITEYLSQFLE